MTVQNNKKSSEQINHTKKIINCGFEIITIFCRMREAKMLSTIL